MEVFNTIFCSLCEISSILTLFCLMLIGIYGLTFKCFTLFLRFDKTVSSQNKTHPPFQS
ncbi:hypothetical protein [Sulfurospirillum sp. hDNRA2]|uniref:hypothetical protein n=1 Tax=Sulfurospirillum sp. hDNRA2 TaxID=3237298 RepID=UPI0020B90140|nr:hypothetical protein [Sulfurospirillum sp. DNRA8]MCP3650837.1 hypothetical protein [Sulfurospirillum sp. DNRA8]MCR1809683.1 hypothetical protein [Sulfurospirillum sp. DNRA8]